MTDLTIQDLRILLTLSRKGVSAIGDAIPPLEGQASWQAIGRLQSLLAERLATERVAASEPAKPAE
jgi:hypothetical protein